MLVASVWISTLLFVMLFLCPTSDWSLDRENMIRLLLYASDACASMSAIERHSCGLRICCIRNSRNDSHECWVFSVDYTISQSHSLIISTIRAGLIRANKCMNIVADFFFFISRASHLQCTNFIRILAMNFALWQKAKGLVNCTTSTKTKTCCVVHV